MSFRKISVVGGGNGAHALAAIAAARGLEVGIWTPLEEEAQALKKGVSEQGGLVALYQGGSLKGLPVAISSDPAEVIPDSDLVILVLPAFAHKDVINKMRPYLTRNCIVGAMPSRSGFEFMTRNILGNSPTIFGVQTLPWACRIKEYGKEVEILGTKNQVVAAASPTGQTEKVCGLLEEVLGLRVESAPNMLAITLGNVGQIIHPGIMYGLFRSWNGEPFSQEKIPLFYQGVTKEMGEILERLSLEILRVKEALENEGINLAGVVSLQEWLLESYGDSIADKTSLERCFNTNQSYRGLKAPVRVRDKGEYLPDFTSRYLAEDVPYGLVITKALAQLAGISTPVMDEVIVTTSKWLGKEYLVAGQLRGKDLRDIPIPQNFGFHDIKALVNVIA